MSDRYVDWTEYYATIEKLAARIHSDGWDFGSILCLARGGLRVGDVLSRIFNTPLAVLAVSSYGGTKGQDRGQVKISTHLTTTVSQLGGRVLVVDDLADSGATLQAAIEWLRGRYEDEIDDIRTGVLWYKETSEVRPNYYVEYLPDSPWIHQPFERYERMQPEDLKGWVAK